MAQTRPEPLAGDFSFMKDKSFAPFLADAYQAVTAAGLWNWFRTETPPEGKGYMFWGPAELKEVEKHMKMLDHHSGASYGMTMRSMESIAKDGWASFVSKYK